MWKYFEFWILFSDHNWQAWNRLGEDDGDPWWEKSKHLENWGDTWHHYHDGDDDDDDDDDNNDNDDNDDNDNDVYYYHHPQVDPDDIEAARKFSAPGRENLKRDVRSALDSLISGKIVSAPFHGQEDADDESRSEGGWGSGNTEAVSEWAEGAKCWDTKEPQVGIFTLSHGHFDFPVKDLTFLLNTT